MNPKKQQIAEAVAKAVTGIKTALNFGVSFNGGATCSTHDLEIVLSALDAATKDSERLDWLTTNASSESGNCDRCSKGIYVIRIKDGTDYYKCSKKLSLRHAIDAARKSP